MRPQRSAGSCFNNRIGIQVEWSGIELKELCREYGPWNPWFHQPAYI